MKSNSAKNLRFNYVVNILDASFFGLAIGFASFSTIIPLFVSNLTDSALLIGMIPAIHNMGWQLPQLFTAKRLNTLPQFKPFVLLMTLQERLPFLGMAAVAWFLGGLGKPLALVLIFLLLIWQGMGSGLSANAWQNMIGKVIPSDYRASFFGIQSAAANLFMSGSAIAAGYILTGLDSPYDFTICFVLASIFLGVSFFFIKLTREENRVIEPPTSSQLPFWSNVKSILIKDKGFRGFLSIRLIWQFGLMGFAFYTVYVVKVLGVDEKAAGFLTSVLLFTHTIANPLLGWAADRWGRRKVLIFGAFANVLSCAIAWAMPGLGTFYLIMILAGFANVAYWTIGLAASLDYGTEEDRPTYVGLANTLIAPATILAPLLGGWLADAFSYQVTFIVSAAAALFTCFVLIAFVKESSSQSA
jgi:MFS family permease